LSFKDKLREAYISVKRGGLPLLVLKASAKMSGHRNLPYDKWRKFYEPSSKQLKNMSLGKGSGVNAGGSSLKGERPFFTVMLLCENASDVDIGRTVNSIEEQICRDFNILYYKDRSEMPDIKNDYIVIVRAGDELRKDALFELSVLLTRKPNYGAVYCDEDFYDSDRKHKISPLFKPDYSPDYLMSCNYIRSLLMVKRSLFEACQGFDTDYSLPASMYDFILKCTEKAGKIYHIDKCLNTIKNTGVLKETDTPENAAMCRDALLRHLSRRGIHAEAEINEYKTSGFYTKGYSLKYDIDEDEMISIVIPNKDHINDLAACIESIHKQDYENYEIIIVENNSDDKRTFEYYGTIEKADRRIRVIRYEEKTASGERAEFNYSKINNYGVKYARGEYVLLLNNDTCMNSPDVLRQLAGPMCRDEVGIVGAKLMFDDDTLQHAGVILGPGGGAAHAFYKQDAKEVLYMNRNNLTQNYSAVTAACLMVKKDLYDMVGGFEEELRVAYNDVDFCLKIRDLGKLVIYNPNAVLYHYESKSRGADDMSAEKRARFDREKAYLLGKWREYFARDPYYNVNLTRDFADFGLREIR